MELTVIDPGFDYMLDKMMYFQSDDTTSFWSQALFRFFPQLDRDYAASLPQEARKDYFAKMLRSVYEEQQPVIRQKVLDYSRHWEACKPQITAALSDAFGVDCAGLFNDMTACISLNPTEPRYLDRNSFDLFYLNSERGAVGEAIHEIIHFVWFYVWHQVFGDSYEEYETPSLKWILSEMVVESVMRDARLSSINPYFPREPGGCVYPYFFDMMVDGAPILDTLDAMYRSQSIRDFMKASYAYCQAHESEIREHIRRSEQ